MPTEKNITASTPVTPAEVTKAAEAAKAARTRNATPIITLLNELAANGYIDFQNETITFNKGGMSDEAVNATYPLASLQGNVGPSYFTTLFNKFNPKSNEEKRRDEIARKLRDMGMNEEADKFLVNWSKKAEADKLAAATTLTA